MADNIISGYTALALEISVEESIASYVTLVVKAMRAIASGKGQRSKSFTIVFLYMAHITLLK